MDDLQLVVDDLVFDASAHGPEGGEVVLLLHGFPQTRRAFGGLLAGLGDAGYRAVAVDQRGYSPRARPAGIDAYRRGHLVADVLALADRLGAERFHVVGHDWGATVAWTVAARHPERLLTLTALSIPHPDAFAAGVREGEQAARSSYIDLLRSDVAEALLLGDDAAVLRGSFGATLDAGAVEGYVEHMRRPGALSAALAWYRAMDLSAAPTGPVSVPTLYLWGEREHAITAVTAKAAADLVTGPYRFEVLGGVGHWLPEECPELVLEHVLAHMGVYAREAGHPGAV